jgi:molybdenum cofactor synthesis domain-containing protein
VRAAIVTISTSKAADKGDDESGPLLEAFARQLGARIVARELLADDRAAIESALARLCGGERVDLVLTTGGTGPAPSDVTPEATRAVIEREIPGIAEAMRLASRPHTAHWMLSRGVAGVRGHCLIVNFPGSPKSIQEVSAELAPALRHALGLIAGAASPHA